MFYLPETRLPDRKNPEARVAFFDRLEAAPAGAWLRTAIEGIDEAQLNELEFDFVLAARARLAASAQYDVVAMAGRKLDRRHSEFAVEELCPVVKASAHDAGNMLCLASAIRDALPATGQALREGWISYAQALAMEQASRGVPRAVTRQAEAEVLPLAEHLPPGRLRRAMTDAIYTLAPDLADQAHETARSDRRIARFPDAAPGSAALWIEGPTTAVAEIYAAIDLRSGRSGPDDPRNADQRRFDALHAIALSAADDPNLPLRAGKPGHINVTMTLGTATGLARKPGHVAGWGPIAPVAAFEHANAEDVKWHAWLVDAHTHYLLGMGTKAYQPTRRLREFNRARHEYSVQPFSSIPSSSCDDEHAIPHSHGGATDPTNTGPVDPHAHRAKHEGGWKHQQQPDGTRIVTSPAGVSRTVHPATYPVDDFGADDEDPDGC